jgi:hypothetical protein
MMVDCVCHLCTSSWVTWRSREDSQKGRYDYYEAISLRRKRCHQVWGRVLGLQKKRGPLFKSWEYNLCFVDHQWFLFIYRCTPKYRLNFTIDNGSPEQYRGTFASSKIIPLFVHKVHSDPSDGPWSITLRWPRRSASMFLRCLPWSWPPLSTVDSSIENSLC